MKNYHVKTIFLSYLLAFTDSSPPGGCQSAQIARKRINDSIRLICPDDRSCPGTNFTFYHRSSPHVTQYNLVHQGSYRYTHTISSPSDAGEFYCTKECPGSYTPAKCYWIVTTMPEMKWNINDTAVLNGSINGSFTATANPCPEVKVIMSNHCNYQTKLVTIDNYTVTVELMIAHVTEECKDIHCYISNHNGPIFTKTLAIIPPVEHPMGDSKANSSIDDGKHNDTVTATPEDITVPTYPIKTANNSNDTEINGNDYDNDSRSSGNAVKHVTVDICVLYAVLTSVLLSLT